MSVISRSLILNITATSRLLICRRDQLFCEGLVVERFLEIQPYALHQLPMFHPLSPPSWRMNRISLWVFHSRAVSSTMIYCVTITNSHPVSGNNIHRPRQRPWEFWWWTLIYIYSTHKIIYILTGTWAARI